MDIKIKLIDSNLLKNSNKCLSVSFDYNSDIVNILKERNYKAFNKENKSWEISIFEFNELIESLKEYKIKFETSKEDIIEFINNNPEPKNISYMNIRAGASNRLKSETTSLFVNYSFNKDINMFLKSNNGLFDYDNKTWEVSIRVFIELIKLAENNNMDINIDSSVKKEFERIKNEAILNETMKNKDWNSILSEYNYITKPYSYQIEGIKKGLENRNLLLTDEQGLGKTLQAIYIADIKSKEENYKYTLIVCGVNGLKHNWVAEIKEHLNEDAYILGSRINRKGNLVDGTIAERLLALDRIASNDIDNRFIITNIETLRDANIKAKIKELCINGTIGMVIIDEIHRVSNIKSAQGDALNFLKARNKIGLTGTPVVNKPFDLYAPLKWLDIEHRSEYNFKQAYGVYVTKYGQGRQYDELVSYKNLDDLAAILNKVMLRREKADVLDLPEVIYMKEFIDLSKKQSKLYNLIRDELITNIEDIILDPNPLAKFTRLRQACSCPSALTVDIDTNTKYNRILELVEDLKLEGKKTIIYSNFAFAVKELTHILNEKGIKAYSVTGEEKNKTLVLNEFKENGDVLVGSIKALGTGYTITEASTIIFLDLPWTYADMIQAIDRAHRIGQKNNITVISLLAKDTVDEKIYKIVKKKQDLFEDIMQGKEIKGVNRRKITKSLLGIKN